MTDSAKTVLQIPQQELLPDAIVSAGKIHMLGLEAIKERLGPKWNRMSALVHRYFESAIRREMAPGDAFAHTSELSYIVLFRGTTLAETQLKCAVIAQEACKRLFGEDDADVSVRSLTLPVNDVDLNLPETQDALNTLLEKEGREVRYYVRERRIESRAPQEIRVRMDRASEQYHFLSEDRPHFLYRPIWDSVRGVVLTYLCQALPNTVTNTTTFNECCIAETDGDQALLDELTLLDCLYRARNLRNSGLRIQFAVPLHFNTLARGRFWRKYSAIQGNASPELLRDLAIFVHGIGPDVPNLRLVGELPKLNAISKHIFCLVDDPVSITRQFRNTGVYALGMSYRKTSSEREWIAQLSSACCAARKEGFETFALGMATRSAAVNAIGAGARFVEGAGVRGPIADPKFGYSHGVNDLYRDDLQPAIELQS